MLSFSWENFNMWRLFLMITLYYQTNIPINFLCKWYCLFTKYFGLSDKNDSLLKKKWKESCDFSNKGQLTNIKN